MRARSRLLMALAWQCIFPVVLAAAEDVPNAKGRTSAFFAFDNGVGRGQWKPAEQARVLSELGYHGIGYTGTSSIPQMLDALDAHGLQMFSTYVRMDLTPGKPPYEAELPEAIRQLKGRGTLIWLHVHGGQPSSADLDDRAVASIREIASLADASGLRVALYPHTGFYVATVQDAVRLVRKVDRKNVGASFNLCHFLKVDDERNLRQRLEHARPYLFAVSINGADRGATREMKWDRLIQTLDRGSFDVSGCLRLLKQLGYDGPIGLQCYGIRGDPRDNLSRSMRAWRSVNARIAEDDQRGR